MIDKSRTKPAKGTLPAFTPVPRRRNRHDGWTQARQRGFIEALADTGSVKAAAHAVNMTPEGAYMLRRHPRPTPSARPGKPRSRSASSGSRTSRWSVR